MIHTLRVFLLTVFFAPLAFGATTWKIDSDHSAANFKIRHMMVSNVRGNIAGLDGKIMMDGDKVSTMKVDVSLDAKTINTNDKKRDDHLRSKDFFAVEEYPKITFKSEKVTGTDSKFEIQGKLTLHGKTKSVTFKGTDLTKEVKGPWGNTRRGFSATTTIDRKDFGITWNKAMDNGGVVVGNEVEVTVEVEMIKEDKKS